MTRRKAPLGVAFCALSLLLAGLASLGLGILFVVAPEALRDGGFRQDASPGIRVAFLLMFGGVGVLMAWNAWGLIRLRPLAFELARALALAMALLSVTRIFDGRAVVMLDWPVLLAAVAMAVYLSLPAVRALLRPSA